ncbi:hypothetical protein [Flavobacterium sp. UBA7680]|uniref:hypothetical protein n=1 Tax=Flavobacterium sp. UBA7680 TaxID=1946559 RepID=UPI0025BFF321|nr:hypothetical protein [Flavobacterium sp. UBA7680]
MLEILNKAIGFINTYGLASVIILMIIALYKIYVSRINLWAKREEYYKIMLNNLGRWSEGLSIGLEYFIEPGSEYSNDYRDSYNCKKCNENSIPARQELKDNMHFGRLFLSVAATESIDELLSEEWHLSNFGSICEKDYLESTLKIVTKTYELILKDARNDLKKSHTRELITGLFNSSSN